MLGNGQSVIDSRRWAHFLIHAIIGVFVYMHEIFFFFLLLLLVWVFFVCCCQSVFYFCEFVLYVSESLLYMLVRVCFLCWWEFVFVCWCQSLFCAGVSAFYVVFIYLYISELCFLFW